MEELLGIGLFFWLFLILVVVLLPVIAMWKVFEKAGKAGFLTIIPIVNLYTLFKIAGKSGWQLFLLIIPLLNVYICVKMLHEITLRFGKDPEFTIGLLFFPVIFFMILGFGSAKYSISQ